MKDYTSCIRHVPGFIFLVRLLNTLIFLKSNVKSRFAGAGFESCPKIKKKLAVACQILYHSILVRLLNTLIFLKSGVKSRFAGAGFEPRRFAAGFRLRLNLPTWFEFCPKTKKQVAVACQVLYHSILVRLAGFEPAAYGLEVRCSIQLSYRRICKRSQAPHLRALRATSIADYSWSPWPPTAAAPVNAYRTEIVRLFCSKLEWTSISIFNELSYFFTDVYNKRISCYE